MLLSAKMGTHGKWTSPFFIFIQEERNPEMKSVIHYDVIINIQFRASYYVLLRILMRLGMGTIVRLLSQY